MYFRNINPFDNQIMLNFPSLFITLFCYLFFKCATTIASTNNPVNETTAIIDLFHRSVPHLHFNPVNLPAVVTPERVLNLYKMKTFYAYSLDMMTLFSKQIDNDRNLDKASTSILNNFSENYNRLRAEQLTLSEEELSWKIGGLFFLPYRLTFYFQNTTDARNYSQKIFSIMNTTDIRTVAEQNTESPSLPNTPFSTNIFIDDVTFTLNLFTLKYQRDQYFHQGCLAIEFPIMPLVLRLTTDMHFQKFLIKFMENSWEEEEQKIDLTNDPVLQNIFTKKKTFLDKSVHTITISAPYLRSTNIISALYYLSKYLFLSLDELKRNYEESTEYQNRIDIEEIDLYNSTPTKMKKKKKEKEKKKSQTKNASATQSNKIKKESESIQVITNSTNLSNGVSSSATEVFIDTTSTISLPIPSSNKPNFISLSEEIGNPQNQDEEEWTVVQNSRKKTSKNESVNSLKQTAPQHSSISSSFSAKSSVKKTPQKKSASPSSAIKVLPIVSQKDSNHTALNIGSTTPSLVDPKNMEVTIIGAESLTLNSTISTSLDSSSGHQSSAPVISSVTTNSNTLEVIQQDTIKEQRTREDHSARTKKRNNQGNQTVYVPYPIPYPIYVPYPVMPVVPATNTFANAYFSADDPNYTSHQLCYNGLSHSWVEMKASKDIDFLQCSFCSLAISK